MYDAVIAQRIAAADYALYQKGIIMGALNRMPEKISILQSIEKQFPVSSLFLPQNLEIANTYLSEENYQAAIAPLIKLAITIRQRRLARRQI